MRLAFLRRIRHPFYPGLKPAPATAVKGDSPALYGTFEELSRAAAAGIRVTRAIFAVRGASDPFLTESQRDALWEMFEAPIYSLLVDGNGRLIAYECEAQDGLHLREGHRDGTLSGRVESKLCECGRAGSRLMPPVAAWTEHERACLAG